MKKRLFLNFTAVLFFSFLFIGCSKDNNSSENVLTKEEQQEIISSYNEINNLASAILLNGGTEDDFEKIISDLQNYPMVEKAWVDGKALMVKFKSGGVISWLITSEYIIPPYQSELDVEMRSAFRTSTSIDKPTNNNACLINQQYGDESRPYCNSIISYLSQELRKNDYDVVVKTSNANVNFFSNEFNKYGVVFCISHGYYDTQNDVTWVFTGEEVENIFTLLFSDLYTWWKDYKVSVGQVDEERGGKQVTVSYYCISDRLFDSQYSQNSFPNSLVYWVACQGMKSPNFGLGQVLQKKGVGVTIGWDETNCLGQSTGLSLFQSLLGGYSVAEAFQALPTKAKKDDCEVPAGANLIYYPNSGGNMYLVDTTKTTLSIYTPTNGTTYNERTIELYGEGNGFARIINGTVEVNGIATTLTLIGDTTFQQPIDLIGGENHIKVSCYGVLSNGKSSYASTELTVIGPQLALFTELRWNTNFSDVDLHLLPPNSSISDLWTFNDCFYGNKQTYWGASLDVDDVDGYGPEHITISSMPTAGVYTLYVHYYDNHGAGATDAFVDVSANNGNIVNFGPYKLLNSYASNNSGDVWAVCAIEFPSGLITPINQYYNLGGLRSSVIIPKKK